MEIIDLPAWEFALAKGTALTGCHHTESQGKQSQCTCALQLHRRQQVTRRLERHRKTARDVLHSSGRGHQETSERARAVTWFPKLCDSVPL
jgi:hypothetical protein